MSPTQPNPMTMSEQLAERIAAMTRDRATQLGERFLALGSFLGLGGEVARKKMEAEVAELLAPLVAPSPAITPDALAKMPPESPTLMRARELAAKAADYGVRSDGESWGKFHGVCWMLIRLLVDTTEPAPLLSQVPVASDLRTEFPSTQVAPSGEAKGEAKPSTPDADSLGRHRAADEFKAWWIRVDGKAGESYVMAKEAWVASRSAADKRFAEMVMGLKTQLQAHREWVVKERLSGWMAKSDGYEVALTLIDKHLGREFPVAGREGGGE